MGMNLGTARYWNSNSGPVKVADLLRYEYDSVNYLYDLEPSKPNLFWAGNFTSSSVDDPGQYDFDKRKFFNAQFRIKSVGFNAPQVTVQEDQLIQHMSIIQSITFSKEVNISWIEDVYNSVRKYHLDWLYNWYDPTADCMVCGRAGKYRNFDLVLYHEMGPTADYSDPDIEPLLLITFRGLIPTNLPNFSFDKGADVEQQVDITYHANFIGLYYNKNLLDKPDDLSCYNDKKIKAKALWAPIAGDEADSGEGNRLTHAITSSLNAEGRIG